MYAPLFALSTTIAPLITSALLAAALATFGSWLAEVVAGDRGDGARADVMETQRRTILRGVDRVYRLFEPLVDELAASLEVRRPRLVARVARQLPVLIDEPPWRPSEWLAARRLGAMLWTIGLGLPMAWALAVSLGPLIATAPVPVVYFWRMHGALGRLDARAETARANVRRALPFAMDLWTLMFRAGATFRLALGTIARHFPLSDFSAQLDRLTSDLDRGLPRSQALAAFARRLGMEEVDALVFAVNQGESLGTPLGQILTLQAQQMRDRHSQAIERAAERIKIKFNGPGLMAMAASFLTMLAPLAASLFEMISW